jgi:hypothetical protein
MGRHLSLRQDWGAHAGNNPSPQRNTQRLGAWSMWWVGLPWGAVLGLELGHAWVNKVLMRVLWAHAGKNPSTQTHHLMAGGFRRWFEGFGGGGRRARQVFFGALGCLSCG